MPIRGAALDWWKVDRLAALQGLITLEGGTRLRHVFDAQPGTELPARLELVKVSHRGGECRGAELADADDARSIFRRIC